MNTRALLLVCGAAVIVLSSPALADDDTLRDLGASAAPGEIPKYDGDLGAPNAFVSLTRDTCEKKTSHILEHYASQRGKSWFSEETFLAILRLRGIEARSQSGYAEGFYGRKLSLRVGNGGQ